MFKKLITGQYPFAQTFWVFGILNVGVLNLLTKIARAFLLEHIRGTSLSYYYLHHFSLFAMDGSVLSYTLIYFLLFGALILYSMIVFTGLWKSSNEYNKSIWLRQIARIFMLLWIYFAIYSVI